ncbi:MAG: DUF4974 domain-containing protein [Bacteroidales bacterium]
MLPARSLVTSADGSRELTLEPGTIGAVNNQSSIKSENHDPNYMSWNTEVLKYNGESLDKTFHDLKRVHGINIITDDDLILQKRITTTFDNQSPDTIITMICKTFILDYEKRGEVYYISRK